MAGRMEFANIKYNVDNITSNYRKMGANVVWMWIFEWTVVQNLIDSWWLLDLTKIDSPTFYTWGSKSIL